MDPIVSSIVSNFIHFQPILGGAKVKGVTSFCLNENPVTSNPFSVEVITAS